MELELEKQIRSREGRRESFFKLAEEVFDLSFREWYENGYWTDQYIPYALCDGDRVAANVAVNLMQLESRGQIRNYVQLGTVMTDPEYRGRGLSRRLMEEVFRDWDGRCNGMYLFANSDVLEFYPRFGFQPGEEYEWHLKLPEGKRNERGNGSFRRLDLKKAEDMEIFRRCLEKGNPYSALQMRDNWGLVMFYCGGIFKDSIFYSEAYDMVCVGEKEETGFYCHELLGDGGISLEQAVFAAAPGGTKTVVLGFSPENRLGGAAEYGLDARCILLESDVTLFFRGGEDLLAGKKLRLPELSHT